MLREPILVNRSLSHWIVSHEGKALGTFRYRAGALRGAIESAYWSGGPDQRLDVLVRDEDGRVYTAWKAGRDLLTLGERAELSPAR